MSEVGSEVETRGLEIVPIQEISKKDVVLEKFRSGDLLVRVMDPPRLSRGENGLELEMESWKEELDFMDREEGMRHASTTMIMEGKAIALYHKPFGFLLDASSVDIEHISTTDSGSGTTLTGELRANKTDIKTLNELKHYYDDSEGVQAMNEVNATICRDGVVGLVIRSGVDSPLTKAELEVVRKYLKEQGMDLPVYEYDERKGGMSEYRDPNGEKLLDSLRPDIRSLYEKVM